MAGPIYVVNKLLLLAILCMSSLAQAASDKVVYHLHDNSNLMFNITVNNLENLIQGMSDQALEIRLLLQGESIHLLNPASISETLGLRVENLLKKGVTIETSKKNYQENEFFLSDKTIPLLVDNIFSRAIELQQMGYRYITP